MSCGVHSRGALYPTDGRVPLPACRTSPSMFPRHNNTAKETLRNGMPKSQPFLDCILSGLLGLNFYTSVLSYAYPFRFVLQQHNAPPSLASLPHLTASKKMYPVYRRMLCRLRTAAQPSSEAPTYCWGWCACIYSVLCTRHFTQAPAGRHANRQ